MGTSALKLMKLPNLKMRRYSSTKLRKFTDVCLVGERLCPHHTNVCLCQKLKEKTVERVYYPKELTLYFRNLVIYYFVESTRTSGSENVA